VAIHGPYIRPGHGGLASEAVHRRHDGADDDDADDTRQRMGVLIREDQPADRDAIRAVFLGCGAGSTGARGQLMHAG